MSNKWSSLVAHSVLFGYESFRLSFLILNYQVDVTEAFNSTSRYLDDLLLAWLKPQSQFVGTGLRLNGHPDCYLSLVGQCLLFVWDYAHSGPTRVFLSSGYL